MASESNNGGPLVRSRRFTNMPSDGLIRLPPHSPESEAGVLGCIMLAPNETMPTVIATLKGGPEEFYDLRHQTIYQQMILMFDQRIPIDAITMYQQIHDRGMENEVGGLDYFSSLADNTPSAANVTYYLETVHDKYLLRQAVRLCTDTVKNIYEYEGDVVELIEGLERDVMALRRHQKDSSTPTIKELIRDNLDTIERYVTSPTGVVTGLSTGFIDLDVATGGLQGGDMFIIAGRPSMGKTSLAMNIAEHVAVNCKLPTSIFSLEMKAKKLSMRMLTGRAHVNLKDIKNGFLAERDYPKLTGAAGRISNAPIYIDDQPDKSLMRIRSEMRRHMQQYGTKLFVVDYLQLMHAAGRRKTDSRQQEITEISAGMKGMAGDLDVPIIVLSQLNRELDKEKDRRPRMSDLRESGAIEQDADIIGMLYKTPKENDDDGLCELDKDIVLTNLYVAKQRDGESDFDIKLVFLKKYTRFESYAKISDEDAQGNLV